MSNPRLLVRGTLSVSAAAALTLVSGPAWAHVEVEADRARAGATDVVVTFHVPNERMTATTRSIIFFFPTDHPMLGVTTVKQNGFSPTVSTTRLATAVRGPRGWVHDTVRSVEFSGGQLSGTQERAFTFHVDQLPSDVSALTFKALQKYSTGETVSWIEVAAEGAAEPEHSAPVLALGPAVAAAPVSRALTPALTASLGARSATTADASGTAAPGPSTPRAGGAVGAAAVAVAGWVLWRRRRMPAVPTA